MELLKYFTPLKRFFSKLYRFVSFFFVCFFYQRLTDGPGAPGGPWGEKQWCYLLKSFYVYKWICTSRGIYIWILWTWVLYNYSLYLKTNTYSGSWISLWPPRPLKKQKTGLTLYNRHQMCSFSLTTLPGGVCNYSFLKITSCKTVTVTWRNVHE